MIGIKTINMKKIGREVAFLKTHALNPRNGEGSFAYLSNGSIIHAYTEYYGDSGEDDATARIAYITSNNEGETWSNPAILLDKDNLAQNYMSISLIRLPNGDLGMFFLRKEIAKSPNSNNEEIRCMPAFCYSTDEGKTWSDYVFCIDRLGYYCGINDGILLQKNGRLLMPLSSEPDNCVYIVASNDCGRSWYTICSPISLPFTDFNSSGLAEPGLYEHENGTLWLYCRTFLGYQYQSLSIDNGKTWSSVIPNLYFSSPDAPMRVKRIGDYTIAVFNPSSCNCLSPSNARRPLVCAISTNDGASFQDFTNFADSSKMKIFASKLFAIENDPANTYCYPSIIEVKDGFLVAYYHSEGDSFPLRATKIVKVLFNEIFN